MPTTLWLSATDPDDSFQGFGLTQQEAAKLRISIRALQNKNGRYAEITPEQLAELKNKIGNVFLGERGYSLNYKDGYLVLADAQVEPVK